MSFETLKKLSLRELFAGRMPSCNPARATCMRKIPLGTKEQCEQLIMMTDLALSVVSPPSFQPGTDLTLVIQVDQLTGGPLTEWAVTMSYDETAVAFNQSESFEVWTELAPGTIRWYFGQTTGGSVTTTVVSFIPLIETSQIRFQAQVTADVNDPNEGNNIGLAVSDLQTAQVQAESADLAVAVNGSAQSTAGSTTVRDITLVVSNNGPAPVFEAQVAAFLPPELTVDWLNTGVDWFIDDQGVLRNDSLTHLEPGQTGVLQIYFNTQDPSISEGIYEAFFTVWDRVGSDPESANNYGTLQINILS